jgi:hypothetical protein
VLSIECIDGDGDEAEEFLRSLGKGESADGNETTKKKKKKKKENSTDAGHEQKSAVQEQDGTTIKKKKEKQEKVPNQEQDMAGGNKKGVKNGGADGQGVKDHNARKRARIEADEPGELAGATGKVDCSDRPKKKNKTQKERKEERRLRIEKQAQKTAAAAAARSLEIAGEEELGSDNEEDGETRTPAIAAGRLIAGITITRP